MLIGLVKASVNRCGFSFRLKMFREADARMFCGRYVPPKTLFGPLLARLWRRRYPTRCVWTKRRPRQQDKKERI